MDKDIFFNEINEIEVPRDDVVKSIKLGVSRAVQEGRKPRAKLKRVRLLIAAACLLIAIPTTALGAAKIYDMVVHKQKFEVNVSVFDTVDKKNDKWYKLKIGYLPENMEADESGMKYSYKSNYAKGGFSFILWNFGKYSDFSTLYSNSYEKKEINGREAVIINKDRGNPNVMFDRKVFLLFKKEGMMLESYIGADVSEEQMIKVFKNISLDPSSKEHATVAINYDNSQLGEKENDSTESSIIPLKKDSEQLYSIGQTVPVTILQGEKQTQSKLEYVIENVEVFDSIKDFKQENFNQLGIEILSENKVLGRNGELQPYNRNVYKVGNGKETLDELVMSQSVNLKFVYLTTVLKNTGKQATEEIYMHPSLELLKAEKNAWNYAGENGINEESLMTGEVDYLEPHGSGKGFYNIGSLQPGETKNIRLGYFVDEDKLDSIFLDAFHYSGVGNNGDMNAKNRWWIDIRQ